MFDLGIRYYASGFISESGRPEDQLPMYVVEWRTGHRSIFIETKRGWLREWSEWRRVER